MKADLKGNCITHPGDMGHFLASMGGTTAECGIFLEEGLTDYDIFESRVFSGNPPNLSLEDQETSL
jgi:hypothetical protein